jgi:hypothetical protein
LKRRDAALRGPGLMNKYKRRINFCLFILAAFALAASAMSCKCRSCPGRIERKAAQSPEVRLPDDTTAGGPFTGRITCLHVYSGKLFAGGWHMGVFQSDDGSAWMPRNDGMTGYKDVLSIADSDGTLYAGTFQGEIFSSREGAWLLVHRFGDGERAVQQLIAADAGLLAATAKGLYLARDGGDFIELFGGRAVNAVSSGDYEDAAILFGVMGGGIGACNRNFNRCYLIERSPCGPMIAGIANAKGSSFIASESDGLFVTRDAGRFERVSLSGNKYLRAVYADDSGVIVSSDGEGLLISDEALPSNWRKVSFAKSITAITRFNGRIYFGTDGLGIFTVEGEGYKPVNEGLLNFPNEIVDQALSDKTRR